MEVTGKGVSRAHCVRPVPRPPFVALVICSCFATPARRRCAMIVHRWRWSYRRPCMLWALGLFRTPRGWAVR